MASAGVEELTKVPENGSNTITVVIIIVDVVLVLTAVLLVIYFKLMRPRCQQKKTKYASDTSNNDHTYDEIAGGNRLSVIQDGRPEDDYYNIRDNPPRSENPYNQLTVYSNQGQHDYVQIKTTKT